MKKAFEERRTPDFIHGEHKYYDGRYDATVLKVLPGQYRVTNQPGEMLVTILGSCVAACVRDPKTGFGGMNHFMLPHSQDGSTWYDPEAAYRYGNYAMEVLINEVLKHGCSRRDLEIKLFGGANVSQSLTNVGAANIEFVRAYLNSERLPVVAEDLGGDKPRRIHYRPATGKVQRLFLQRIDDCPTIEKEDHKYQRTLIRQKIQEGDIELFD